MIINHGGVKYDIQNWDEFSNKLLSAIGFQVENEIVKQIDKMRLVDTGSFRTSLTTKVIKNSLIIDSSVPYAKHLEYGTMEYWQRYGRDSFPLVVPPKKKDVSKRAAKKLPKGVGVFAPFRRTLWNQNKMAQIITKAVKVASR